MRHLYQDTESADGYHRGLYVFDADPLMLEDLFDVIEPDHHGHASDHRAGAWAILSGIAANTAAASAAAVYIRAMLRSEGLKLD